MKILFFLYFTLVLVIPCVSQSESNFYTTYFFEQYLTKIKPCANFVTISDTVDSIRDLPYKTHSIEPTVFFKNGKISSIALLNNFFDGENSGNESDFANQSKYLLVFSFKHKAYFLFLNSINLEKTLLDTLRIEDLFMTNRTVHSLVFDSCYRLMCSFNIYPKNSNSLPIIDIQIDDTSYIRLNYEMELNYEDFIGKSLSSISLNCDKILDFVKLQRDKPSKIINIPSIKNTYYVKRWRVR